MKSCSIIWFLAETQVKAARAENITLQASLLDRDREHAKREGELVVGHAKELSDQAVKLSHEITSRDGQIQELRKDVAIKIRDARVLEEQTRAKVEVDFQIKYLKLQQEFEQSVFAEADTKKLSLVWLHHSSSKN